MTLPTTTRPVADEITRKAGEVLEGVDRNPFSVAAFDVLKGKVGEYVSDVVRESEAIARRQQADIISAKHVQDACDRLTVSPRRRLYKHIGTIGGIALGISGSGLITILTASESSIALIGATVITALVGGIFLGISIRSD
jgi:hypothetical protein